MFIKGNQFSFTKKETYNNLYYLLREFRQELARENGIAPYMILHDKSLKELSEKKPSSVSQLKDLHGWGEKRIQKYGKKFIKFLQEI